MVCTEQCHCESKPCMVQARPFDTAECRAGSASLKQIGLITYNLGYSLPAHICIWFGPVTCTSGSGRSLQNSYWALYCRPCYRSWLSKQTVFTIFQINNLSNVTATITTTNTITSNTNKIYMYYYHYYW